MKKEFWDNFYNVFDEREPSSFAKFLNENFLRDGMFLIGSKIMDIGCGNGRDTIYFKDLGFDVIGIDQSLPDGLGHLDIFQRKSIEELIRKKIFFSNFDVAYCRFLFHAIDEELENKLLDWIRDSFRGGLCAEFRSNDGKVLINDNHYRRLIDGERFLKKLIEKGFKIKYYQKGRGLSNYKGEDPILIRVVAEIR